MKINSNFARVNYFFEARVMQISLFDVLSLFSQSRSSVCSLYFLILDGAHHVRDSVSCKLILIVSFGSIDRFHLIQSNKSQN